MDLIKKKIEIHTRGDLRKRAITTTKIPHHLCAVMEQIIHSSNIGLLFVSGADLVLICGVPCVI